MYWFCVFLLISATYASCANVCIHTISPPATTVFGIKKVFVSDKPIMNLVQKSACITSDISLPLNYSGLVMNFMNMSITKENCILSCQIFVCGNVDVQQACKCSNMISTAIHNYIAHCDTDFDCVHNITQIPDLYCPFRQLLANTHCPTASNSKCGNDVVNNIKISDNIGGDDCYLTNPFCNIVVDYVIMISILLSVTFFLSFVFIVTCCCI
jgi:hypothetical protein